MAQILSHITGRPGTSVLNGVEEESDTASEGTVTKMNPSSGAAVKPHSSVTVYVSKGKPKVEVPRLAVGTVTFKQAKQVLEAKGFKVVASDASAKDDDIVTGMSEKEGAKIDKGSTITLTVKSATPSPDTTKPGTGLDLNKPSTEDPSTSTTTTDTGL